MGRIPLGTRSTKAPSQAPSQGLTLLPGTGKMWLSATYQAANYSFLPATPMAPIPRGMPASNPARFRQRIFFGEGAAWDGEQLLIADSVGSRLYTLARNANGTYSPANAVNQGTFPSDLSRPTSMTWDGRQVINIDSQLDTLWTLSPDNAAPSIDAIAANPTVIDSGGTTALTATVTDPNFGDTPTYRWVSSVGGSFGNRDARNTNWDDAGTATEAQSVTLTLTATDESGLTHSRSVTVTVREPGGPPLVLPDPPNQTGETGNVVDVLIATATGGRSPYTYAFEDLPPELGAVGRRIRGQLTTSGTVTARVTVTDANGDTVARTFTWTVTGTDIVPPTGINVRIDWGASFYTNPNANVTGRITSGIQFSRGKASNTNTRGRTAAGRLTFQLDNSDGLYDLENTNSPLSGLIRPGIRAQVRDGGALMWTGVLDSIPTTYRDNGQHRASVTAFGVYSTLREAQVIDGSFGPETTGQVFCTLLEGIGECGVTDGTFFSMPRWWESGPLREALRHIEDTEGGFIYEDRLGQLGFQSGAHRDGLNVSAQFTGIAPALPGEIRISGRPKRDIAVKDVTNEVVGLIREYAAKTGQVVFERGEPIAIGLGDTVTLIADYEGGGAVSEVDAVTSSDYTATRDIDGGGDRRSALTVTATIGQFNEIRVEVVYPTGGGFTDQEVFLRSITVNGTVLSRLAPAKVTRRDDTSISRYKLKTLTLRDTWIDNAANMTARADALLAVLKSPETRLEFDWFVEDYALFRALELSDRIQLRLPGYTEQAFIEHVALNIPNDGVVPICTVQATVTPSMATPPPPPPAEDSVTVPLTGVSEFTNYIRWSDNQSLGSLFDANDAEQVLTYADLNNAGPAGQVGLSIVGTNNRFTAAFEASGRIIFEASDGETLEVMIADADMSEPYVWVPSNGAEVVAFVLHVKGLVDQTATLTLTL